MSDAGTRPLRVLQILRSMEVGGAETLVMNLYRHINRSRIQFDFLLFSDRGYYEPEILELGGVIHRLPYLTDVGLLSWLRQLGRFFRAHPQYRIVHSHLNTISGPILMMAKRAGVPVRIAHSHACYPCYPSRQRPVKGAFRSLVRRTASHFYACSRQSGVWLFGASRSHLVRVLHNGVDLQHFEYSTSARNDVRAELGLHESDIAVGHVGRFDANKNQGFLLRLMAELAAMGVARELVLVGTGPCLADVTADASRLDVSGSVHFLGFRTEVGRVLSALDGFLLPSLYEGMPVSLVEAQASGLPCFVSDSIDPGVAIIPADVTFLPLHDPKSWVERLSVLTQRDSQERIDRHRVLSKAGYDICSVSQELAAFYQTHSGRERRLKQ